MNKIYLRKWSDRSKVYIFYRNRLEQIYGNNQPEKTNGFVKHFPLGKRLIIYRLDGAWIIEIDRSKYKLEEIQHIEVKRKGVITYLKIKVHSADFSFIDISLMDAFARTFDPTYDHLDEELVFGFWLKELFRNRSKMGRS